MRFVFLMDPLSTVKMEKDTSFILMLGAHRRGHTIYFLPDGGITKKNQKTYFHVTRVIPQQVASEPFILKEKLILDENSIDAIFIRRDPPFNESYLLNTWLLENLQNRLAIINSPAGIRSANEKIWAAQFSTITPQTLISRQKSELKSFLAKEKNVIVKPTNGFGGSSVFRIQLGDENANVILETVSQNWAFDVIMQKYIPDAKKGDKRILLLNGEPLGAVLRVHAADDHRNNFFAGGKPKATTITPSDKRIISILKPKLRQLGLYFVGIDIIGKFLVEVNVTSPTCLQEMNRLNNAHLEEKVIDFAEKYAKKYKRKT